MSFSTFNPVLLEGISRSVELGLYCNLELGSSQGLGAMRVGFCASTVVGHMPVVPGISILSKT